MIPVKNIDGNSLKWWITLNPMLILKKSRLLYRLASLLFCTYMDCMTDHFQHLESGSHYYSTFYE